MFQILMEWFDLVLTNPKDSLCDCKFGAYLPDEDAGTEGIALINCLVSVCNG